MGNVDLADFYRNVFGWQIEQMPGVDYPRVHLCSSDTASPVFERGTLLKIHRLEQEGTTNSQPKHGTEVVRKQSVHS